jgi:hypothetical protein
MNRIALAVLLTLGVGTGLHGRQQLQIHYINVGWGSSVLVIGSDGRTRNYMAAIPTLEAYLKANPGLRHHTWGPTFAVRALLKLKGIPDGSGGYERCDDETIRDAIWGG